MTKEQYISYLTSPVRKLSGMDVPHGEAPVVIDGLCDVIVDRETVISERDRQIARLHDEIAWLRRMVFGRRSERIVPDDPRQLSFDFGEEVVVELSPDELRETEERGNSCIAAIDNDASVRRAHDRRASSRKGTLYRIPRDIPRDEPTLFYPDGYSEENMEVIRWNTHEYLEMDKPRLHVRVDKEAVCKLRGSRATDAHTEIYEAHGCQNCLPGCKAGNSLLASIVVDKFCDHLPEYRQSKRYSAMGIHLPTSSINTWLHSLACVLRPLYDLQASRVFSSNYQHVDESVISVNDRAGKTRKGYMWSDVDGMGEYGLAFFYSEGSRSGRVIRPKLLEREVSLQTDGYVVYRNMERMHLENLTTLYCMAHARRKFEAIKDMPEAARILKCMAALYTLETNLKHDGATVEEIYRQRQEKAVPILGFIRSLLDIYVMRDTPSGSLAKACSYAIESWEGLCRYCDKGYYDIDNNAVERSIRPLTLGRKNWLFVDSDESARDTAIYMTLAGSCNLLGITPYKYFMAILPQLHTGMTNDEYERLLPYAIAEKMR